MSESSIPFQGQTAVMDAADQQPLEAEQSRRTVFVVAGLAALVVIVGIAAYFLLFAGGSDDTVDQSGPPAAGTPVAPAEEVVPEKVVQPRISAKSFGRDPFEALIVDASTDSTATGAETATTDAATSAGSTTSIESPASTAPVTNTPVASTPHKFRVVDVAPDNKTITVKVDGKQYPSLRAGEVFATIFKVRFIGGPSNSFQIGDEVFNVAGAKAVMISG